MAESHNDIFLELNIRVFPGAAQVREQMAY